MLIFRYICREVIAVVMAILLIMLIITLMSQAAGYLGGIAHGAVAVSFFGKLILINIPFLISYILPFAFYFGLLLAYGRIYADSEMVVLQASGFSNRRLFTYTMILAAIVMLIVGYLIFLINPTLLAAKGKILHGSKTNVLQTIVPGQFRVLNDGKLILYVSKANHNRTNLQDIFLAELNQPARKPTDDQWSVNFVSSAQQVLQDNDYPYLQTKNGYQYKGIPGQQEYSILKYKDYNYLLKDQVESIKYNNLDGISTIVLFHRAHDLASLSELEWRISLVIQVIILTLFAIPLSRVQPRQGRYAKFLPAILFYLVYVNVLFVAKYLLENDKVSMSIGLWWAHLLMLFIVMIYYAKVYHWFAGKSNNEA